jgi:hypothetical protein
MWIRGGIAELRGSSTFKFLRKLHIIFHSIRAILCSHQHKKNYTKFPDFPYSCQHLLFSVILIIAILIGGEVLSPCNFDLQSPDDLWCGPSFHAPAGHLYVSLEWCLFDSFTQESKSIVFCYWVLEVCISPFC